MCIQEFQAGFESMLTNWKQGQVTKRQIYVRSVKMTVDPRAGTGADRPQVQLACDTTTDIKIKRPKYFSLICSNLLTNVLIDSVPRLSVMSYLPPPFPPNNSLQMIIVEKKNLNNDQ